MNFTEFSSYPTLRDTLDPIRHLWDHLEVGDRSPKSPQHLSRDKKATFKGNGKGTLSKYKSRNS